MVLIKTILGLGMLSMCVAPVIAAAMPESAEGLADVPDGLADVFDEVADVSPAISEELTAREELSDQRVKFPKSQKRLNMHTERYLPLPIPGTRMLGTPV
ncbi:hypothetical protein M432DRAFT_642262 [Thermoascus aurantiacus ATCC 26904]